MNEGDDADERLMQVAQASMTNGDAQLTIDHRHIHSDFYIVK
ncbi:MAG: hypothetical protein WCG11_01840 [Methylococcaceae bacterium]